MTNRNHRCNQKRKCNRSCPMLVLNQPRLPPRPGIHSHVLFEKKTTTTKIPLPLLLVLILVLILALLPSFPLLVLPLLLEALHEWLLLLSFLLSLPLFLRYRCFRQRSPSQTMNRWCRRRCPPPPPPPFPPSPPTLLSLPRSSLLLFSLQELPPRE